MGGEGEMVVRLGGGGWLMRKIGRIGQETWGWGDVPGHVMFSHARLTLMWGSV